MDIKKIILFNVFLFTYTYSLNEETFLRNDIMQSYNKYVRPVNNFQENLDIKMGLAVQNIEEFDQKKETLDLNISNLYIGSKVVCNKDKIFLSSKSTDFNVIGLFRNNKIDLEIEKK